MCLSLFTVVQVCQPWAHNAPPDVYCGLTHIYTHRHTYHTLSQPRPHNLTLSPSPELFELRINRLTATAVGSELQLDISSISSWDRSPRPCSHSCRVAPTLRQGCDLLNWSVYGPYLIHFFRVRAGTLTAISKRAPGCPFTRAEHRTSDRESTLWDPGL